MTIDEIMRAAPVIPVLVLEEEMDVEIVDRIGEGSALELRRRPHIESQPGGSCRDERVPAALEIVVDGDPVPIPKPHDFQACSGIGNAGVHGLRP